MYCRNRSTPLCAPSPSYGPFKVFGHDTCGLFQLDPLSYVTGLQSLDGVNDGVFKDREVEHGATERFDVLRVTLKPVHSCPPLRLALGSILTPALPAFVRPRGHAQMPAILDHSRT